MELTHLSENLAFFVSNMTVSSPGTTSFGCANIFQCLQKKKNKRIEKKERTKDRLIYYGISIENQFSASECALVFFPHKLMKTNKTNSRHIEV